MKEYLFKCQTILLILVISSCSLVYLYYNEVAMFYQASSQTIAPQIQIFRESPLQKNVSDNKKEKVIVRSRYFETFKIYPEIISGSSEVKEKLIVLHSKLYGLNEWLSRNFTKDGVFFRFSEAGYSCPRNCVFTHETKYAGSADAVVFSVLDSLYRPGNPVMPKGIRPKNQVWVGVTSETSVNHLAYFSRKFRLNYALNWTVTYRRYSDVQLPYGYIKKIPVGPGNESRVPSRDESERKGNFTKGLAVGLISNCMPHSYRDYLIKEMNKSVPIQLYGKCGKPCPNVIDCRQFLAQRFKFYLAFENSLCEDYVTEKFFQALHLGIVPVVFGLANYKKIAPPHSYISVLDFPSVPALVNHLQELDRNETEYQKYLEWKKDYRVIFDPQRYLCDICVKLWENNHRKEYHSFSKWWSSKKPSGNDPDENNYRGLRPEFREKLRTRKTECFDGRKVMKEFGIVSSSLKSSVNY